MISPVVWIVAGLTTINVTRDCQGVRTDGRDVSDALATCIANCINASCGAILLPAGKYLLAKTVRYSNLSQPRPSQQRDLTNHPALLAPAYQQGGH